MNNFDKIQQKSEYDIRFKYLYNKIPFPNGKLLKDFTLDDKIEYANGKIRDFFNLTKNEPKKISFSGGKDSTVLAHLVRQVEKELNLPPTPLVVSAEIFHPLTLEYLKSLGYEVYRIEWNTINKKSGKELMKEKIDKFLEFYNI